MNITDNTLFIFTPGEGITCLFFKDVEEMKTSPLMIDTDIDSISLIVLEGNPVENKAEFFTSNGLTVDESGIINNPELLSKMQDEMQAELNAESMELSTEENTSDGTSITTVQNEVEA